jgi:cysteine synthase
VDGVKVLAKCEFLNPGYSIKDRIVMHILDEAEASGALKPGMTIVAASSGNTGAATAMAAANRGYKCIIITSPKCSREKMDAIRAYGVELMVTAPGLKPEDPAHYMNMELVLCAENKETYFGINQYENQLNPQTYYNTLGPEIWEQTEGKATHFVAAGSTGGTLSGTARFLKEASHGKVKIVMADPVGSIFFDYYKTGVLNEPGKFEVEGVGKEDIPGTMDFTFVDYALRVSDKEAFAMCHRMARDEGIMAGGSGGLNVHAAVQVANQATKPATVVTVIPDSGIKYLSKIYNMEWLRGQGIHAEDIA